MRIATHGFILPWWARDQSGVPGDCVVAANNSYRSLEGQRGQCIRKARNCKARAPRVIAKIICQILERHGGGVGCLSYHPHSWSTKRPFITTPCHFPRARNILGEYNGSAEGIYLYNNRTSAHKLPLPMVLPGIFRPWTGPKRACTLLRVYGESCGVDLDIRPNIAPVSDQNITGIKNRTVLPGVYSLVSIPSVASGSVCADELPLPLVFD